MNAIVTIEPAPTAGPHGEGHTVFSPQRQAEFLQHLQLFGNVRLACRAARVSAQTAYRQRRASAALAQAWDAALLAARAHAEATLADRAINGVEEAVYYHGEEIARKRRYSDRLLLAHLARLDRLEERADVVEALGVLDAQIDALREGEALAELGADEGPEEFPLDRVPSVPSCRECGGECDDPDAELTEADCGWESRRIEAMEEARPLGAPLPQELGRGVLAEALRIEALQLEAFEAGAKEWWLVTGAEDTGSGAR